MKKRYYRNNSNDSFTNKFLDTLGGILGIFFLYLVLTFYVNRAQFWHIMSSFILPVVIAIVVLFSLYLYYLAQRKKRETNRFEDTVKKIKEIGFDVKFNTFIDMFGKEGKGDNFEDRG